MRLSPGIAILAFTIFSQSNWHELVRVFHEYGLVHSHLVLPSALPTEFDMVPQARTHSFQVGFQTKLVLQLHEALPALGLVLLVAARELHLMQYPKVPTTMELVAQIHFPLALSKVYASDTQVQLAATPVGLALSTSVQLTLALATATTINMTPSHSIVRRMPLRLPAGVARTEEIDSKLTMKRIDCWRFGMEAAFKPSNGSYKKRVINMRFDITIWN